MILFVFEGEKRERKLFKTLEELYFPKKSEHIICSFCNNIYSLYRRVSETGEDIVSIIKSKSSNSEKINWSQLNVGDFSQVFLFFDYDCHDSSASDEKLERIKRNWLLLRNQHVMKANYICMGANEIPKNKMAVCQSNILKKQIEEYIVPEKSVAVLCAFPLFLFEYFKM